MAHNRIRRRRQPTIVNHTAPAPSPGDFGWPTSNTNEIDRLHNWLNDHWPWLERW